MTHYIMIITTVATKQEAQKIAQILLTEKLAACVQIIGPIESAYCWDGENINDTEWLCQIKSKMSLFEQISECIKSNHSYKIPEIIALPIIAGSREYFDWLDKETQ
ncbi:MAG: divalent-cation tolerance protein CutA [Deltaproteobacteria bacterium]